MPPAQRPDPHIAATKAEIRRVANWCARNPLEFAWLHALLQSRGVHPVKGILVRLVDVPENDSHRLSGVWLTESRQFWEFRALISESTTELLDVDGVVNVTAATPVNDAASFGFLACQVLQDLRQL